MKERFKKIQAKLLEIWNKYTKKQRTIFLSIVGSVIVLLVILILILSRTVYMTIGTFSSNYLAAQAVNTLTENGIKAKLDKDKVTVLADEKAEISATILLTGTYGETELFPISSLLENSLSTTDSDRRLKNDLYTRSEIESGLKKLAGIKDASVIFYPTGEKSSIYRKENNKNCSVILTTTDKISSKTAESLAEIIAAALGNIDKEGKVTTEGIKIMDQNMNLLFGGTVNEEEETLTLRQTWITWMTQFYHDRAVELGEKNGFDTTAIPGLSFNFDEQSVAYKEYIAAEGSDQGLYGIYKHVSSENTGAPGDVAGTDSNDDTDYFIVNNQSGNSSYESTEIQYLPNEKLTNFTKDNSQVIPESSSLTVTLNKVTNVYESVLKSEGALDDISFEDYIKQHETPRQMEQEEYEYMREAFAMGLNIPSDRIALTAYEVYDFIAETPTEFDWSLVFKIALAVLIIGLLLFVLLRGMRPETVVEQEPELSIEQLLATTKENQSLEDIELSEKSETLRLIEKLVDENPQAVANLLRNWLEDDWG